MGAKDVTTGRVVPLAWFETFLSVFKHRDYARAATECDQTIDVVQKHVAALTTWLGLPLVVGPQAPLLIVDENAPGVAMVSEKVLRRFEQAMALVEGRAQSEELSLAKSSRSAVTLFQLRVLTDLAGLDVLVVGPLKCDDTTIRRQLKSLEALIGCKLYNSRRSRDIPSCGSWLAEAGKDILLWTHALRFVTTDDLRLLARQQKLQRELFVELIGVRRDLRVAEEWKRPNAAKRQQRSDMRSHRAAVQSQLDLLAEAIGPIPNEEVADLHFATLVNSMPRGASIERALDRVAKLNMDSQPKEGD